MRSNQLTGEGPELHPIDPSPRSPVQWSSQDITPVLNARLRCPLPPVVVYPDNLRQFYRGGITRQFRIIPPQNKK